MKCSRRFLVFIVQILFARSEQNENIFYDKGWRPISNEEAYRGLFTNFQTSNNVRYVDTPWNPTDEHASEDINHLKNNAIRLVKPQKFREFVIKREDFPQAGDKENEESINEFPGKTNRCGTRGLPDCSKINTEVDDTADSATNFQTAPKIESKKNERKAKKLSENTFISGITDAPVVNSENELQVESTNRNAKSETLSAQKDASKDCTKTYEVTENSPTTDSFETEQTKLQENTGYVYRTPKQPISLEKAKFNLTNTFLEILSRYNISGKDRLDNYERSRIPNIQNSFKPEFVYVPIPVAFPGRYNSLNHLPVNPFLAVLLSNYGVYLPRSFGVHNNYRNLYGYLASNNIHNNKPFGVYKVFSDTDSSNK